MTENTLKVMSDFVRVLLGLDTGAVVLIAALVRSPIPSPGLKVLLAVSVGSFVISILGCVVLLMDLSARAMAAELGDTHPDLKIGGRAFSYALYMFIVGTTSLAVFVMTVLLRS
ncbi:MAG: hypothetical protein ACE145_19075 [Terriglobia bacterium]